MSANQWVLAARPATLWAGIAPVIVGSAIAVNDGVFRWDILGAAMVVAVAVQVGVNFANDLADARRGADTADRIGPTRAVSAGLITPRAMTTGVLAAFGVAGLGGAYLTVEAGPVVPIIGVASIVAALTYTGGPFPYGYHGLGEAFVFVFFGLVATVGTRFVFDESAPGSAWLGGVVMGLLASAILVANNIRDIETDAIAGKRTLAVIIGRGHTRGVYTSLVISAFATAVAGVIARVFPPGVLLMLVAVPLAIAPIRTVRTRTDGPSLISALKGTARLQVAAALLIGLGLIL